MRAIWLPTENWKLDFTANYEYSDEGGYVYGLYHEDTSVTDPVSSNEEGKYRRGLFNAGLSATYQGNNYIFNSVTSYQRLDDRMYIDQDFTSKEIYTLEQKQRLNALTVPILMKSQNSQGAMHLKKEEWDIIMQNTDACFNDFTLRLKDTYPQLTLEEVRFACLLKMEFSLSLLSEVYHIAKGSISRKKMRLKEKMQIENMTLDDFIKQF